MAQIPPHPVPYRPLAHVLRGDHHMPSLGTTTCAPWEPPHVLLGSHHMYSLRTSTCPPWDGGNLDWNTRNVLTGTQENFLVGTQEMSCVEHRNRLVWEKKYVPQGARAMLDVEHNKCLARNTRAVLCGTRKFAGPTATSVFDEASPSNHRPKARPLAFEL